MDTKTRFRLITAAVLATIVVVVLLQNVDPVETKFLFVTVRMPRAALILIAVLVGFVLGLLFRLGRKRSK